MKTMVNYVMDFCDSDKDRAILIIWIRVGFVVGFHKKRISSLSADWRLLKSRGVGMNSLR